MSHSEINAILQDSLGFLWIGTQDGLNKYDGYSFEHFRYQPDTLSLSDNTVRCITEGQNGILWIGTENGLNKLDRLRGYLWSFFIPLPEEDTIHTGSTAVYDILEDAEGKVWARTGTSLQVLDPGSGEFTAYDLFGDGTGLPEPRAAYSMVQDREGHIWMGSRDGLQVFDPEKGLLGRYTVSDGTGLKSNLVRAVLRDGDSRLWVGTDSGLYIFDIEQENFTDASEVVDELEGINVYSLAQTRTGLLVIGSDNGFLLLDPGTDHARRFKSYNRQGLVTGITTVYSIVYDASEILWIATDRGLVKIDMKPGKFDVVNNRNPVIEGLSSYMITSICQEDNGDLWLGTNGKGLNYVKAGTSQAIVFSSGDGQNPLSNDFIHAIYKDRAGNLWIGTGNGVNLREAGSPRFYRFCEREPDVSCGTFNGKHIYDITEDSKARIWFAASNGVHVFNPEEGTIQSHQQIFNGKEMMELRNVSCVLEDRHGWIWMGSSMGLIKYIPDLDRFEVYQAGVANMTANINNNTVYTLMQDSRDRLWIGTASGLNRYDPREDRFEYIGDPVELSELRIYSILEDNEGSLWLSSDRGLFRYHPDLGTIARYGLSDGLPNDEFYPRSGFKDPSGRIYLGGTSGITSFHPDSILYNSHIPPLSFTQFVWVRDKGGISRPLALDRVSKVTLPGDVRFITIRFSALDFTNPDKNRYMYRMVRKGQDGLWIHNGEQHHVTFNELAPGTYTLSIKGSNNDLVYNEEAIDLEIVVPYSFWGRGFAVLMYILAGLTVLFMGIRISTLNLRKSNRILREKEIFAKEISKQREELAMKNKNITDSINYAKRIQIALLPSLDHFKTVLPDSFVLYKPKDIVSGDFYWVNQHGDQIYVAAVDCTGHGVPGAFVSIIGFELFRKITASKRGSDPAIILDTLNDNFKEIFSDGEQVHLKDGMDLSLCVIDKKEKSLDFSGALNPLYLIRNETIIEVKADRFSVGADAFAFSARKLFKSHKIYLQPDDIFYMFSDGYADQFGGPEGKKFKYRRFRHLLLTIHKLPLEKQQSILDASIEEWMGNTDQIDDILVIGIRPGIH